jgi:hypothetical protein
MSKFKRTIACVAAASGLAAPLAVTAPANAYSGSPGCVTLAEHRSIHEGMSQTWVAKRFGTSANPYWGSVTFRWDSDCSKEIDRNWRICNRCGKPRSYDYGEVDVDFEKEADWETGEFPPGPLLSTYKSRWSYRFAGRL